MGVIGGGLSFFLLFGVEGGLGSVYLKGVQGSRRVL